MSAAPLTLVTITVRDYKGVRLVRLEPKARGLNMVRGRNAQGKSSFIDAIETLIRGKAAAAPAPVRRGAARAEIEGDFGAFTVRRRFSPDGAMTLKITSKDPAQPQNQRFLDQFYGTVSVDASEFMRLRPAEQAEQLRAVLGIDTSTLDRERARLFEERTAAGREVRRLEGAHAEAPFPVGADEPVDLAALIVDYEHMRRVVLGNEEIRRRAALEASVATSKAREAAEAFEVATRAQERADEASARALAAFAAADALVDPDSTAIRDAISGAETTNEVVRLRAARRALRLELDRAVARQAELTLQIDEVDEEKARLLAEAPVSLPGVGLDGDQVLVDGLPFEQAAESRRLLISARIALANKPGMPILLIRSGGALNDESREVLAALAEETDAQAFVEQPLDANEACPDGEIHIVAGEAAPF